MSATLADLHAHGPIAATRRDAAPERTAVVRSVGVHRYLLSLRCCLINATGFALLGAIWVQGWIGQIVAADDTGICRLIFGLFLLGLFWTGQRVLMLSRELNALDLGRTAGPSRAVTYLADSQGRDSTARTALATALRLKLAHRIAPVRHLASTLVLLGLIGTIIGFIIALSGVDPAAVTEASAIGPMVATLLHGMSMALFKTLVGSVLNVWLMVNYRLLESGTIHLWTRLVETGERHAAA